MSYQVKILIISAAVVSWVGCGGPVSPTDQDQNTNDVCVSGDTRPGETVCGLNEEGLFRIHITCFKCIDFMGA